MAHGRTEPQQRQGRERELARLLADLTGHDVRRRVRQHDGDDDLVGVPGWSIEAKRYKAAPPFWWRNGGGRPWNRAAAPMRYPYCSTGQTGQTGAWCGLLACTSPPQAAALAAWLSGQSDRRPLDVVAHGAWPCPELRSKAPAPSRCRAWHAGGYY